MVLSLILIGLAIAFDPLPLMAFMVVVPSKRGVRKGAAFVFGWVVSLAIVVTITVLATGNNPPKPNTVPSLASRAVKIAIGVVLVVIAIRRRRTMGQPKKPKKPPKWQATVDTMTPLFALALFCVLASASYLAIEIYAGFKPDQALLIRFRSWIDSHTDQAIILGSFILGFWLIANPEVSPEPCRQRFPKARGLGGASCGTN